MFAWLIVGWRVFVIMFYMFALLSFVGWLAGCLFVCLCCVRVCGCSFVCSSVCVCSVGWLVVWLLVCSCCCVVVRRLVC